jgi:MFS superfamily sulfate permease-like transporter
MAFLLAGVARLGAICSFIAKPVLRGFAFGLALTIVLRQLPKMTVTHGLTGALPVFPFQWLAALSHGIRKPTTGPALHALFGPIAPEGPRELNGDGQAVAAVRRIERHRRIHA